MIKSNFFRLLIFLSAFGFVYAQNQFRLEGWESFTSLMNVKQSAVDSKSRIWAATDGGLFVWDRINNETEYLRNINALLSLEATAINYDPINKKVIVGCYDGMLEILDENFVITHITSIRDKKFANSEINQIIVNGDLAFIAGGFGITVFDIKKNIFLYTIERIADLRKNESVRGLLFHNNKIIALTNDAIAIADANSTLQVPDSWNLIKKTDSNKVISKILDYTVFNNDIYILSEKRLLKLNDTIAAQLDTVRKGATSITNFNNQIVIGGTFGAYYYSDNNKFVSDKPINKFTKINDDELIINMLDGGIIVVKNDLTFLAYSPNSPLSNRFSSIGVNSEDGTLWGVSAEVSKPEAGKGIYALRKGKWFNINSNTNNEIINNLYYNIKIAPDGSAFISNWGDGVAVINFQSDSDNLNLKKYNYKNAPFEGENGAEWNLVGETEFASDGTAWMVNWGNISEGPILVSMDKKLEFKTYNNCKISNERRLLGLAIDNSGTKWIASYPGVGVGLFYFNERGTEATTDDKCGLISSSTHSGLLENSANCIASDKSGYVWIGTGSGLSVIINPSAVLYNGNLIVRSVKLLAGQRINDILVDAVGNKWIATNTGVWVINYDGSELIYNITKDNSPLPTNEILSLAQNNNDGTIYFGTTSGLFSAKSLSVLPKESYDIVCYPQPFKIGKDKELVIDGLAQGADVRIVTVDGQLVKSIQTQSRTVVWDGRKSDGSYAGSGVYLIVSKSILTDSDAVAKVVLINE